MKYYQSITDACTEALLISTLSPKDCISVMQRHNSKLHYVVDQDYKLVLRQRHSKSPIPKRGAVYRYVTKYCLYDTKFKQSVIAAR